MKKKIDEKKKLKNMQKQKLDGLLPNCIAVLGVQGCATKGHDTTTARPRYGQAACDTVEGVRDTAHSALGWEQGHDTKICIEGGGLRATLGRNTMALRCDTVQ